MAELKKKGKKLAKIVAGVAVLGATFGAGAYFSDETKGLMNYTDHKAAPGFHKRPYDLQLEYKKDMEGRVGVFLKDGKTEHRIGEEMYVGDLEHNAKGTIYNTGKVFEDIF